MRVRQQVLAGGHDQVLHDRARGGRHPDGMIGEMALLPDRYTYHYQVHMRSPCGDAVVSQATDQPYAAQHLDTEVVSVQSGHRVESRYGPADEPQRRHDTTYEAD
jgi:hypothetical protein